MKSGTVRILLCAAVLGGAALVCSSCGDKGTADKEKTAKTEDAKSTETLPETEAKEPEEMDFGAPAAMDDKAEVKINTSNDK